LGALTFYLQFNRLKKEAETVFLSRNEIIKKFVDLQRDRVTVMRQLVSKAYLSKSTENQYVFSLQGDNGKQHWQISPALETTGILTSKSDLKMDASLQKEMAAALAIDMQVVASLEFDPDIAWLYYLSKNNFVYLAPGKQAKTFQFKSALYQQRYWIEASPDKNPERRMIIAGPYSDMAGKGWLITFAEPVYMNNVFMGIVALDLKIDILNKATAIGSSIGESMLISENNRLMASQSGFIPGTRLKPPVDRNLLNWLEDEHGNQWLSSPVVENEMWLVHKVRPGEVLWSATQASLPGWLLITMLAIFAMLFLRLRDAYASVNKISLDLERSQERYNLIAQNSHDVIWIMEYPSRRYSYISQACKQIFGWEPDEIINQSITDSSKQEINAVSEKIIELTIGRFNESNGLELHSTFELKIPHKDERLIPVDISASILLNENGKPSHIMGITRDISERDKIAKLKNEFISTVSHELRTPLTSIRGSLGLLVGGVAGELPDKAKPLIDIAHKNSERLILLVNDILDIEKVDAGKMVFEPQPVVIKGLLEHAIESNKSYADQFKVSFKFVCDTDESKLYVDANRLMQVMANLLSNATKFSELGGIVVIECHKVNNGIRVAVKNGGAGIPNEFKDKIFQKFMQVDASDSRRKGGTGLGLTICKTIVEKMGGTIGFKSEPNVETEFYFEFPEWHEN